MNLFPMLHAATFLAVGYLALVALWVGYLAYCTINRVYRDKAAWAALPWIVRSANWVVIAVFGTLDVAVNVLIMSFIFTEPPHWKRLTFTARCKNLLKDQTYRGDIARWVCDGWLNPFETGHC